MNLKIAIISLLIILPVISNAQTKNNVVQQEQHQNYVPDSTTAVKIAEAVLLPIYKEGLHLFMPFRATLISNSFWQVEGMPKKGVKRGPITIQIQRYDSKILGIYSEK